MAPWSRRSMLTAAVVCVACAVTACAPSAEPAGGGDNTGSPSTTVTAGPSSHPSATDPSPAESTPVEIPAATGAPTDQSGNVLKAVGQAAELVGTSGNVAASVTVNGYQLLSSCPGEFATAPENGHYLVVDVTAAMPPGGSSDNLLLIGPAMWRVVTENGSVLSNLETAAAWQCYDTDQRLPNTIAPGEQVSGLLVLDVSDPHGDLVFTPTGGKGWTWPIEL